MNNNIVSGSNSGNPFHEIKKNGVHYLVQRNRHGLWFAYINCLVQDIDLPTHNAALAWLNRQ